MRQYLLGHFEAKNSTNIFECHFKDICRICTFLGKVDEGIKLDSEGALRQSPHKSNIVLVFVNS